MKPAATSNWDDLVLEYRERRRAWDEAFEAYDALPPNESGDTSEERRYESARRAAWDHESRILEATAPHAEAALFQLRLFGERYHGIDMDDPSSYCADQPEGLVLRRIHDALAASPTR